MSYKKLVLEGVVGGGGGGGGGFWGGGGGFGVFFGGGFLCGGGGVWGGGGVLGFFGGRVGFWGGGGEGRPSPSPAQQKERGNITLGRRTSKGVVALSAATEEGA